MTVAAPAYREHGNAYNIFILVLTIFSLVLMVYLLLPLDPQTRILATAYDNLICVVFLIDFGMNLAVLAAEARVFHRRRGWLDLLGSIPTFGVLPVHRALPPVPDQSADPDLPDHGWPEPQGDRQGRPRQPRRVRDVHHDPARGHGAERRQPHRPERGEQGRPTATSRPVATPSGGASSRSRPSATGTTTR